MPVFLAQQFKPGYTAPPQLFHYGGIPMNFRYPFFAQFCFWIEFYPSKTSPTTFKMPFSVYARGNWEVSRRDINNHRFITMVPTARDLVDSDDDDYSVSSTRNMMYCRTVAIVVRFYPFKMLQKFQFQVD